MKYTINDVMEYVREEDVKFIRLAFCDVEGTIKNVSIMPGELGKAFTDGIAFDGSAIKGFERAEKSDLLLFPDPDTLTLLPWRPSHGRVIRLFCDIKYADGKLYELDSRLILKKAIEYAESRGIRCDFGAEFEFYLFKLGDNGEITDIPCDEAGYMDVAPKDRGENIRREICLTIEEMGLYPECSHHEEGPGQNEIDFRYSDALSSADHAVIFKNATESIAYKNGFFASFAPKPVKNASGSGMHVNVSLTGDENTFRSFYAGVMRRAREATYYFNPTEESYERLGGRKAPHKISWGEEDRTALIRIPASKKGKRFELRSPDGEANVYIAYALIIYAGTEGVEEGLTPERAISESGEELPGSLSEARDLAANSSFIKKYLPAKLTEQL